MEERVRGRERVEFWVPRRAVRSGGKGRDRGGFRILFVSDFSCKVESVKGWSWDG